MQLPRMIACAALAAGLAAFNAPLAFAAEEKKPADVPAGQVKPAAGDASQTAPRNPDLAFDGAGDPKSGDAPPPRDRGGRLPGGKDPGKPDDNDEASAGPGGPDGGPGGPGGRGDGPGGPGRGPGDPGRRPGGPGGDGPPLPRDGRGPGPGGKPGDRLGPEGRRPPDGSEIGRNDPEMAELLKQDHALDKQTNDLAAQYRNSSKDEKVKLRKEIVETVNKHFDVRQQRRKLQLDRMQKELERLRTEIDHRTDQRETLVKGRVQELLGDGGPGF